MKTVLNILVKKHKTKSFDKKDTINYIASITGKSTSKLTLIFELLINKKLLIVLPKDKLKIINIKDYIKGIIKFFETRKITILNNKKMKFYLKKQGYNKILIEAIINYMIDNNIIRVTIDGLYEFNN
jgi:hypothetical protein